LNDLLIRSLFFASNALCDEMTVFGRFGGKNYPNKRSKVNLVRRTGRPQSTHLSGTDSTLQDEGHLLSSPTQVSGFFFLSAFFLNFSSYVKHAC